MLRILVAEDERVTARLMAHLLKPYGGCTLAADGETALSLFKDAHTRGEPFELIFLDIGMPKMNGNEVLEAIRDFEAAKEIAPDQGVKIIVTTIYQDTENVLAAHVSGCQRYLVKPLNQKTLHSVLITLGLVSPDDDREV